MAGILDLLSGTGFTSQTTNPSLMAPIQEFPRVPARPTPDMSGIHPLIAQLMAGVIRPPVPLPQIQLPTTHPMSMGQAGAAAGAVAAATNPFWPGPFRAQSAPQ
jgi:hypothetical protein